MKRYDVITKEDSSGCTYGWHTEDITGEFVRYDDISRLLKLCKDVVQDIRTYNDDDPTASPQAVQDLYKELKKLEV